MTPEQYAFLVWAVAAWSTIMMVLGLVAVVHAICNRGSRKPPYPRYMDGDE